MAKPKYTIWEAINAALSLGKKALDEVRHLARQPGPPGRDGFGFDDLHFEQRSDREFVLLFTRGDEVKEFALVVPSQIHRGVWREGQAYERGDTVTWGGSMWHCDEPTKEKPDGGKGWTLSVKRGRDGRDFRPA